MNNNKGFTLIELIIVIVIIGMILVFAIPNVVRTTQKIKKEQMIEDGKNAIEKTRNYVMIKNIYPQSGCSDKYSLKTIDENNTIKESPYKSKYETDTSYVKICLNDHIYEYSVYLVDIEGNKLVKSSSDPVSLKELNSEDKYAYVKEKN